MHAVPVPQGVKLDLPAEALAAFKAAGGLLEAVQGALWWGAFQQGLLWGLVGATVAYLLVSNWRRQ